MIDTKGDVVMNEEFENYSMLNENKVRHSQGIIQIKGEDDKLLIELTVDEFSDLEEELKSNVIHKVEDKYMGALFNDDEDSEIANDLSYFDLSVSEKQYAIIDTSGEIDGEKELRIWTLDANETVEESFSMTQDDFDEIRSIISK